MIYKTASGVEIQTQKESSIAEIHQPKISTDVFNALPRIQCEQGEVLFLSIEVLTPAKVTESDYLEIERFLEPFVNCAKSALGWNNSFRQAVRITVDKNAPSHSVESFCVIKQGVPIADERRKVRLPKPSQTLNI
jgi:biotin synthase-related radical SAM superfamily protein